MIWRITQTKINGTKQEECCRVSITLKTGAIVLHAARLDAWACVDRWESPKLYSFVLGMYKVVLYLVASCRICCFSHVSLCKTWRIRCDSLTWVWFGFILSTHDSVLFLPPYASCLSAYIASFCLTTCLCLIRLTLDCLTLYAHLVNHESEFKSTCLENQFRSP